jgi:Zn finger protein HypA/HybF involved in hydrogenase expression
MNYKESEIKKAYIDCPLCGGKGKQIRDVAIYEERVCPSCHGAKMIIVYQKNI